MASPWGDSGLGSWSFGVGKIDLGRGWTFDVDEFSDRALKGIAGVGLAIVAPVVVTSTVGRAVVVGAARVVVRAAPVVIRAAKTTATVAGRVIKGVVRMSKGNLIAAGIEIIKNAVPTLTDRVVVVVKGQPGAVKKTLYYLALSAGFGVIRRFDFGLGGFYVSAPPGNIQVRYNLTENWVEVVIEYTTSLIAAAATQSFSGSVATSAANLALFPFLGVLTPSVTAGIEAQIAEWRGEAKTEVGFYKEAVIYSGPKEGLIGGDWGFTGISTPLVPTSSKAPGAPTLPFAGYAILTNRPANNPRPPGDNRSRGTVPLISSTEDDGIDTSLTSKLMRHLLPLVYSALTNPSSFSAETFVAPSTVLGEG